MVDSEPCFAPFAKKPRSIRLILLNGLASRRLLSRSRNWANEELISSKHSIFAKPAAFPSTSSSVGCKRTCQPKARKSEKSAVVPDPWTPRAVWLRSAPKVDGCKEPQSLFCTLLKNGGSARLLATTEETPQSTIIPKRIFEVVCEAPGTVFLAYGLLPTDLRDLVAAIGSPRK